MAFDYDKKGRPRGKVSSDVEEFASDDEGKVSPAAIAIENKEKN